MVSCNPDAGISLSHNVDMHTQKRHDDEGRKERSASSHGGHTSLRASRSAVSCTSVLPLFYHNQRAGLLVYGYLG
jgi:hypothetical protein